MRLATGPGRRGARGRLRAAGRAALLAVALACSEVPEPSPSPAQEPAGDRSGVLDAEDERRMEELLALGYVQGVAPAATKAGVFIHLPAAWAGYNLTVSAHGPEAELLDMDGRLLHRWRRAFREVWPARKEGDLFHTNTLEIVDARLGIPGVRPGHPERGRAFEIDRDGQVVWEYWNPHRVEVDGEAKTATLYEVMRLPPDFPAGWATGAGS